MAGRDLPAAKAVLLAVQLARKGDISAFRTIVSQYPKALSFNIVLRILLSHLPETLESAAYVPFIEELASGTIVEDSKAKVDSTSIEEISNAEAAKKVKKLHLLPLAWPQAAPGIPQDPLVLFLIHRSLRIDKNTGLLVELPDLLAPFLSRSAFLREWTISTVLPLLRFNYEYHPQDGKALTIPEFENLDDRSGVALLLSRTGKVAVEDAEYDSQTIGRDIRGLVGPWMYGASSAKRQKLRSSIDLDKQIVTPLTETEDENMQRTGWEEVFKWIVRQGATSWGNAVEAVEQWEGPGDVDLGGYDAGSIWLEDEEQQQLERGYARAALAAAYVVPEESTEALNGVHRILARLITLLDLERLPPLSAAAAFLEPVPSLKESGLLAPENAKYLRNSLLGEENLLTQPKETAIRLIHALLISAYILTKAGLKCSVRKTGELVFFQVEQNQKDVFTKLLHTIKNGPKADDTYWKKIRNEILWLHNWGAERSEGGTAVLGRGVFGLIRRDFIEAELLKIFLTNTRYILAKSIYLDITNPPLSKTQLHDTILAAAMNAYDNASNANKTRGALKVADDMLKVFADYFKDSSQFGQQRRLIDLTDKLGKFALVLKPGVPFTPIQLRVQEDPVGIIGKLLAQNTGSCTKLDHLLSLGDDMVDAGLTQHKSVVRKRILGMCIANALAEDDFETAYSYVVGRLQAIGGPAQAHSTSQPSLASSTGLSAQSPPKNVDEWSWIAAFEAGKHLGNATGHGHIQHLERRIECLVCALRLAPKDSVHVVLNVYRRCEEELTSKRHQEAEQEAAWDEQADAQAMPGGFAETPVPRATNKARARDTDEAPMSIFDLSRSTVSRAQKSLSSLTVLNGAEKTRLKDNSDHPRIRDDNSGTSTPRSPKTGRKRDIVKSVATDTLASGIGWLIGAPGPTKESR